MSHVTLAYQSDRDGFELTIKDDEVKGLRTKLEELARVSQKALRYDNETMAADSETVIALRQQLAAEKARADKAESALTVTAYAAMERDGDPLLDLLQAAYDEAGRPRPHDQHFEDWCEDLARRTTPSQSGGE